MILKSWCISILLIVCSISQDLQNSKFSLSSLQENMDDIHVWEDDWDDDNVEDDFSLQLRAELEKNNQIKK